MVDPESVQTITLDLPWPPTANRYWRNVNGRMVLSRAGREYREYPVDYTGVAWLTLAEWQRDKATDRCGGGGCPRSRRALALAERHET